MTRPLPGGRVDNAWLPGPQRDQHGRVGKRSRVGGGHTPDPHPPVAQVAAGDVFRDAGAQEAFENSHG